MKKLTEKDYRISTWGGGNTIQIAIYPETEVYADRTFGWRLSSATVDLEESDFTALPDYDRLIAPLNAHMVLSHNGGKKTDLAPLQAYSFDGADETHSWGRCTDFNLMMRKDAFRGDIVPVCMEGGWTELRPAGPGHFILYCVSGSCKVSAQAGVESLSPKESVLLELGAQGEVVELQCEKPCTVFTAWVSAV